MLKFGGWGKSGVEGVYSFLCFYRLSKRVMIRFKGLYSSYILTGSTTTTKVLQVRIRLELSMNLNPGRQGQL